MKPLLLALAVALLCVSAYLSRTPVPLPVVLAVALPIALLLAIHHYNATVVPLLHRAVAAYSRGDEPALQAILQQLEASVWRRTLRPNLAYLRALQAFEGGDLTATRRHLDASLAAASGWLPRPGLVVLRASSRALRALVAALSGDEGTARHDLDAITSNPDGMVDVPALKVLAEAILLLRAGEHRSLQRLLDRHRALLLGGSLGRSRLLARALLRPWEVPDRQPYRGQADQTELPSDPATSWIVRLVPELAPLLARRPLEDEPAETPAPAPAAPPAPVAVPVRQVKRPNLIVRVLAIWALVGVLVVAVLRLGDQPRRSSARHREAPQTERVLDRAPLLLATGPLLVLVFAGVFAWSMRRQQRLQRQLNAADLALLQGQPAAAIATYQTLLGNAHLAWRLLGVGRLASVANRLGDPAEALRWTEQGQAELKGQPMLSAPLPVESVVRTEEAMALALLGRAQDAQGVLDRLDRRLPGTMLGPTARFTVGMVSRCRAGDLPAARAWLSQRTDTLLLGIEHELLADLVKVTGQQGPDAREQATSLLREAASEPTLLAWLTRAAPAVLEAARAQARG